MHPEPALHDVTQGRQLRILRVALGLSQSAVAERAGVGRLCVSKAERGRPIRRACMVQILRALGVQEQGTQP